MLIIVIYVFIIVQNWFNSCPACMCALRVAQRHNSLLCFSVIRSYNTLERCVQVLIMHSNVTLSIVTTVVSASRPCQHGSYHQSLQLVSSTDSFVIYSNLFIFQHRYKSYSDMTRIEQLAGAKVIKRIRLPLLSQTLHINVYYNVNLICITLTGG